MSLLLITLLALFLNEYAMMKQEQWQELDLSDFEELESFEQKKQKKQSKRKWREIEAIKERNRERKELAYYDNSYAMDLY